ncbi:MAG: GNAT family N-acetyltransferase, partial [Anaerolineae bacterium]|nr:GNAT family N-acetyltransferase [Anaerolineae bacterium]
MRPIVNFRIRPYTKKDKRTLIETINSVCAEGRWMETRRYEPTPSWEHALQTQDCPYHLLLVLDNGERIVGWCRVFPDTQTSKQANVAIGLLAEYRGRGWGTKMFQQAMEWAFQQGFTRLYLTTRASNTRAIRLFNKFGFVLARPLNETWIE